MRRAEENAGTHGTSNRLTVPPPPTPLRAPPAAAPSAYRATLQCSFRNANPVRNGCVLPQLGPSFSAVQFFQSWNAPPMVPGTTFNLHQKSDEICHLTVTFSVV